MYFQQLTEALAFFAQERRELAGVFLSLQARAVDERVSLLLNHLHQREQQCQSQLNDFIFQAQNMPLSAPLELAPKFCIAQRYAQLRLPTRLHSEDVMEVALVLEKASLRVLEQWRAQLESEAAKNLVEALLGLQRKREKQLTLSAQRMEV